MSITRNRSNPNIGKEVFEAIISYSPDRLTYLINQEEDPDSATNAILSSDNGSIDVWNSRGVDTENFPEDLIIKFEDEDGFTWPLHVAIVALYHAVKKDCYGRHTVPQALKVIDILIANGAAIDSCSGDILLMNIQGYNWHCFREEYPLNQAVHLAIFFKKRLWRIKENETNKYLDIAIAKLQQAQQKNKAKQKQPLHLKTTTVLDSVASSYRKMLFNEKFSDVTFECSDGVSIPAHRNILSMSSNYFETALQGDWAENSNGTWKTSHSSTLMKPILTILYTGSVEESKKIIKDHKSNPLELFEVSCEYNIETLIAISVDNCIKSLGIENVSEMIQKAHLHSNEKLKLACFDFVKSKSTQVLTRPDAMQLATDAPESWKELCEYLNGKSNKKARAS